MGEKKYVTFKIEILRGFMANPKETMIDAVYWCIADEICRNVVSDNSCISSTITDAVGEKRTFRCGFTVTSGHCKLIKDAYMKFPKGKGDVYVSVPCSEVDEVIQKGDVLREWDKVVLLGYWALRSIDGRREKKMGACNPMKANNGLMWARMAGYKTWQEFTTSGKAKGSGLRTYMTEYYARKLRNDIQDRHKNVKIYAKRVRGFYFTTKHDVSLFNVVEYAMTRNDNKARDKMRWDEINRIEREVAERMMGRKNQPRNTRTEEHRQQKGQYRNTSPAARPVNCTGWETTDPKDF